MISGCPNTAVGDARMMLHVHSEFAASAQVRIPARMKIGHVNLEERDSGSQDRWYWAQGCGQFLVFHFLDLGAVYDDANEPEVGKELTHQRRHGLSLIFVAIVSFESAGSKAWVSSVNSAELRVLRAFGLSRDYSCKMWAIRRN